MAAEEASTRPAPPPAQRERADPVDQSGRLPEPLPWGACLGRYRIEATLGIGAMSIVYRASDPHTGRHYALKVLRADVDNATAIIRFLGEPQTLWLLHHPNIVRAYERVTTKPQYFVMPYVPGRTLRQVLQQHGMLPVREAVSLTLQLARALNYAHVSLGIVHRDVKPENLWITVQQHLLLLDFGLACDPVTLRNRWHLTPAVEGTPSYMAPELVDGKMDARTDVYAAGICLYEMLVGGVPSTPHALQRDDAAHTIPAGLWALLQHAIASDPQERCPNAAILAAQLTSWLHVDNTTAAVGWS